MPSRVAVIACGVFERELNKLAEGCPHTLDIHLLDAGLHARPSELRLTVQAAVDQADSTCDAVVLFYGLCGSGLSNVRARSKPILVPRVHDCIALFMGGAARYREQFSQQPGTRYLTAGWYEKKTFPPGQGLPAEYTDFDRRGSFGEHPMFAELARVHGQDNATFILKFFESWKKNYSRVAMIDTGVVDTSVLEEFSKRVAEELNWSYERIEGSLDLLAQLLALNDRHPDVLVVSPGEKIVLTGDAGIMAAVPVTDETDDQEVEDLDEVVRSDQGAGEDEDLYKRTLGLGVDAGGTYTDSVLYRLGPGEIVAKSKARTTHGNLLRGIADSVAGLPAEHFADVGLVAVSTTLATNAIVEDTGARVGLIVMNPPHQNASMKRWDCPTRLVGGRVDIAGNLVEPVDPEAVLAAVREMIARHGIEALAVSGYGGTVNNTNELTVKEVVQKELGLPVVCGHELTGRLDFHRRGATAVLNARLVPVVSALIEALQQHLTSRGVNAPLMIVRGDGSLVGIDRARQRPIHTILSGPAASAAGAARLVEGVSDAVIVDMGGTTTDTVTLREGRIETSRDGAQVGRWQTSVEALDILTAGVGGDSLVSFDNDGRMIVGPQRVEPMCRLASARPEVIEVLRRVGESRFVDYRFKGATQVYFLNENRTGDGPADGRLRLSDNQRRAMDLLGERPYGHLELTEALHLEHPVLLDLTSLLERGIVLRAGPTPTDLLHVEGRYTRFDAEAARSVYGIVSALTGKPPERIVRDVRRAVTRKIALEVLRKLFGRPMHEHDFDSCDVCTLLLDNLMEGRRRSEFELTFNCRLPLIGIGAPAGAWLPDVAEVLGTQLTVPEAADVANAVGAVTSHVVIRRELVIRPGETAAYVLTGAGRPMDFQSLGAALAEARRILVEELRKQAAGSGTASRDVHLHSRRRIGHLAGGDTVFLEMTVEGLIRGIPALRSVEDR